MEKKKIKAEIRIVVIGDSFVFGAVPRKNNFVSVMGELARKAAANIEIWNMGIPGTGPENYLSVIRQDAVPVKTDIVCVVFFIGNEITQSHPDFKIRMLFGALREILRTPYLIRLSPEYFYTCRFVRVGARLAWHYLSKRSGDRSGTFAKETYLSMEHQRLAIYKVKQDRKVVESYSGARGVLKRMALEVADNGMGLLVVLAPDELQVNPCLRDELMQRYGLDASEYNFGQPQKVLMGYLHSQGVEAVDLLPDFVEAKKTKTLYLRNDTHWNEQGNQLAAQRIWGRLHEVVAPKD